MKKIPLERRQNLRTRFYLSRRSVERIANHGMSNRRKMNTNLMRAPCMQIRFYEAISIQPQKHPPICARLAALAPARSHTSSTMQVSRHGKLDTPGIFLQTAVHQRHILLLHSSTAELLHQRAMRGIVSRNQQ